MIQRCSLAAVMVAAFATPAAADNFKLFAEVDGGGAYGEGTSGAQKDAAFFHESPHGAYGAEIGAELFFIDAWISHHQFTNGDRLTTWTKFGAGMHFEIDFEKPRPPPAGLRTNAQKLEDKKNANKPVKSGGFAEVGLGLFFGVGTGQQVDPPLDNSEITDKALQIEARIGLGKHVSNIFDIGVIFPVSYGYFIKNDIANDLANHYRGVQGEALLYVRANVRIF